MLASKRLRFMDDMVTSAAALLNEGYMELILWCAGELLPVASVLPTRPVFLLLFLRQVRVEGSLLWAVDYGSFRTSGGKSWFKLNRGRVITCPGSTP